MIHFGLTLSARLLREKPCKSKSFQRTIYIRPASWPVITLLPPGEIAQKVGGPLAPNFAICREVTVFFFDISAEINNRLGLHPSTLTSLISRQTWEQILLDHLRYPLGEVQKSNLLIADVVIPGVHQYR